jgi:hypothetical protein
MQRNKKREAALVEEVQRADVTTKLAKREVGKRVDCD